MINQEKSNSSRAEILEKIKSEFLKFRGTGRGKYSPELRALACAAVVAGIGRRVVSQAGGVSLSAIHKWVLVGRKSKVQAKRLNLVASSAKTSRVDRESGASPTTIRLRLVSGVEIELPRSELNAELLTMLIAIGGQR